jgi:glycosyltransferase involved in cell wall biosynthesis
MQTTFGADDALPRTILQVNMADVGGGAEAVALELHRSYVSRGLDAWLAVGWRRGTTSRVIQIPSSAERVVANRLVDEGRTYRARAVRAFSRPIAIADVIRGREDFRHPGSRHITELTPSRPELIHLHNLHGGYFDLRTLPELSSRFPVVWTLHDEWAYTGHCAGTLGCERWRVGCGSCPHLDVYPALVVDGTKGNIERKRRLYARSPLAIVTPSAWLLDRAANSILAGRASFHHIPNGIDLESFAPGDRREARASLGVEVNGFVIVYAAPQARTNPFKDFATLRGALVALGATGGPTIRVYSLGEEAPIERIGRVVIHSIGPVERSRIPQYLRAADLYLHAARAENHSLTVMEALATGTPVIASRVGGIREQVRPLDEDPEPTGVLVPPRDASALAGAISRLIDNEQLRGTLARRALSDARSRFADSRMVAQYLELYAETTRRHRAASAASSPA